MQGGGWGGLRSYNVLTRLAAAINITWPLVFRTSKFVRRRLGWCNKAQDFTKGNQSSGIHVQYKCGSYERVETKHLYDLLNVQDF